MKNAALTPELASLDEAIRQGQILRARKFLSHWLRSDEQRKLQRSARAEVASLCRRAGIPSWGIKLLNPLIRPTVRAETLAPLPLELSEYANCLALLGADREALQILKSVDPVSTPQCLLSTAFAHFSRWEYKAAIPILRTYVQHHLITGYAREVGRVNLAAALVAEDQHEEASLVLSELLENTRSRDFALLRGNSLLLSAQRWVGLCELEKAAHDLSEAAGVAVHNDSLNLLLLQKWKAIVSLKRNDKNHSEIRKVRSQALKQQQWEVVRDCDFHLGVTTRDPQILRHLYFGTPFRAYRERLESIAGFQRPEPDERYFWRIRDGSKIQWIDAKSGECSRRSIRLKFDQVPQRLLAILVSDFYRPHRLAALHADLFPDRHYHPIHSPVVMRQAMLRLRRWINESRLALEISEQNSNYRLRSPLPLKILVPSIGHPSDPQDRNQIQAREFLLQIETIVSADKKITRASAARVWNISERSAFSRLQLLTTQGYATRRGSGHTTHYVLSERSKTTRLFDREP